MEKKEKNETAVTRQKKNKECTLSTALDAASVQYIDAGHLSPAHTFVAGFDGEVLLRQSFDSPRLLHGPHPPQLPFACQLLLHLLVGSNKLKTGRLADMLVGVAKVCSSSSLSFVQERKKQ